MAVLNTVTVLVIFLAVTRSQLVFSNTGKHASAEEVEKEDKDEAEALVPRSLDAWSILYPVQEDDIQFPSEEQQIERDAAVTAGPSMARSSRDSPSFGVPANDFKPAHKAINPSQHDDFLANKRRQKRHLYGPSSSWSLHAHHNPSHHTHEELLGEESLWFEEDPLQYPEEEIPWQYPHEGALHEEWHDEPLVLHDHQKRFWIKRRPKQMRGPSHLPDVSRQFAEFALHLANNEHATRISKSETGFPRFGNVGERCKLSSGAVSKCALITECPSAVKDLKRGVRPVHCGFKGRYEIVCCGDMSDAKPRPDPTPQGGGWNWGGSEVTKPTSPRPPPRTTSKPTTPTVKPTPLPVRTAVGAKAAKACKEYERNSFQRFWPYIAGGTEAMLQEFPHMVLLGYPDGSEYRDSKLLNGSRVSWQCGGTLIDRQFVLTAAHCVDQFSKDDPFVARVGELDYSTDEDGAEPEDVGIVDFILHPDYHPQQSYNDIALIKLARPIVFSHAVQPACLPEPIVDTASNTYLADRKLTVTGWGDTEYVMDKASPRLMKADMKSVPLDVCNKSYVGEGKLPRGISNFGHLCAEDRNGTSADACRGDSGGPLQEALPKPSPLYRIVGVTAAGKACAGIAPTIYTRVADYVGWIESVVWPST